MNRPPTRDHVTTALVAVLFIAVGALAWRLELRSPLRSDTAALSALPPQLTKWEAADIPLGQNVEVMLRADYNLMRAYTDPGGDLLWAYVGYYGTARGGRPEHTPAACYAAQGWSILERRVLPVPGSPELRVNEYLVQQGSVRELVHFWFRSYRSTGLLGGWDQALDRFVGRVQVGRADGALVRVSTRLGVDDVVAARGRLLAFAAPFDHQLALHWPTEPPVANVQ